MRAWSGISMVTKLGLGRDLNDQLGLYSSEFIQVSRA